MITCILINPQVIYSNGVAVSFNQTCVYLDDEVEIARDELSFPYELSDEEVEQMVITKAEQKKQSLQLNDSVQQTLERWDWIPE